MMGAIVRTNAATAGRSLVRIAVAAGAILIGYTLVREFPSYRVDRASEKRAEEILALIGDGSGDIAAAQELRGSFVSKGLLQEDEAAMLEAKLSAALVAQSKRATETAQRTVESAFGDQFNALLAGNALDDALALLSERSASAPLTAQQLSGLRGRVEELREPNLGQRMQLASIGEKVTLAEEYLRRYPKGTHRQDAVTYVLLSAESNLSTALAQPNLPTTYTALVRLNALLGEYGKPPTNARTLDALLVQADGYLATFTPTQTETPTTVLLEQPPASPTSQPLPANVPAPSGIGIGSLVWHGMPDAKMLPAYLKQRDAKFGNSSGRVVAIEGDVAYVQFESGTNSSGKWPTAWGWLKPYTDRGVHNVGSYKLWELLPAGAQPPPAELTPLAQPEPPEQSPPAQKPEGVRSNAQNLGKQNPPPYTPSPLEEGLFRIELDRFRQYVGGTNG